MRKLNFFTGFSRLFEFNTTYKEYLNENKSGFEQDLDKIKSDWEKVGNDLRKIIE